MTWCRVVAAMTSGIALNEGESETLAHMRLKPGYRG